MADPTNYPKVSIITPSYNQAQFIKETILSVKNQDYPNIEHIVIDGGSCDGTLDILRKHDRDIIWISEPDKGQYDAMNKGFKTATGEILTWLNSDDVLFSKEVISNVVSVFKRYHDVDIVHGDFVIIDEKGNILLKMLGVDIDFKLLLYGTNPICPSAFFRKTVFSKVGFFDPLLKTAGDFEFWLRAAQRGMKFKLLPMVLFKHRYHSNSMSMSLHAEMHAEQHIIRQRYREHDLEKVPPMFDDVYLLILRILFKLKWQFKKLITRGKMDNLLLMKHIERKYR